MNYCLEVWFGPFSFHHKKHIQTLSYWLHGLREEHKRGGGGFPGNSNSMTAAENLTAFKD